MGNIRQFEPTHDNEFEAIIDDLENWPSVKVIAEHCPISGLIFYDTILLINESIGMVRPIAPAYFTADDEDTELIDTLQKHIDGLIEEK